MCVLGEYREEIFVVILLSSLRVLPGFTKGLDSLGSEVSEL